MEFITKTATELFTTATELFTTATNNSNYYNNQFAFYCIPAVLLVAVLLVFTFGFRKVEQPHFEKLYQNEDRTGKISKKRNKKDKKIGNGHIGTNATSVNSTNFVTPPANLKTTPTTQSVTITSKKSKNNNVENKAGSIIEPPIKQQAPIKTKASTQQPITKESNSTKSGNDNWEKVVSKAEKRNSKKPPSSSNDSSPTNMKKKAVTNQSEVMGVATEKTEAVLDVTKSKGAAKKKNKQPSIIVDNIEEKSTTNKKKEVEVVSTNHVEETPISTVTKQKEEELWTEAKSTKKIKKSTR